MTALSLDSPLVPPRGIDTPLQIPPPDAVHPLRFRRVLALLREVHSAEHDDDKVEAALTLFDAVGGLGGEKTFQRFARTPEGRRLLRTRPDLVGILADRDLLRALPDGSFGRAYLAFAERNGFSADSLLELTNSVDRERPTNDTHREWFWNRFTVAHDLWHVLTGCSTEGEGEIRLLAFTYGQTPQRGYVLLLGLGFFSRFFKPSFFAVQWRAWRAGRRAADLVSAPWEQYLAWPLDEVRRCFGIDLDRFDAASRVQTAEGHGA